MENIDAMPYLTNYIGDEILNPARNTEWFPSNLKVLVAEDNPANLKVVQLVLRPFTAVFDSAENGIIALEKFKANKYDIIFMDVQMPGMNGYEATKKIRKHEIENSLNPVEIVAMTANVMKEDIQHCLEIGMNQFLGKPFELAEMIKIIRLLPS